MSTINLAIKKHEESAQRIAVRRWVKSITTVILIIYVVGAGGLLGWWWYTSSSSKRVNQELVDLTVRVEGLSQQEAVARRLSARTQSVATFLDGRRNITEEIELVTDSNLVVDTWEYDGGRGITRMIVSGGTKDDIEALADTLVGKYTQVKLLAVRWSVEFGWTGEFTYGGPVL